MRRKKNDLVTILVLLILVLSLGYAFLQTDLTINGTGKIAASSWNIYFDNVQVTTGSVALSTGDSVPTINSTTLTDITYTVTLKEPGDFYEFTVDVVNAGTIDGMIGTITNKLNGTEISTTNPLPNYLSYTITYSDDVPIALNQLLEKNTTETYKVRLAFRTDINPSDLPTSGATNTLSFSVSYVQADDTAQLAPHIRPEPKYMANMDVNDHVFLGQALPTNLTQFQTPAEAMAFLVSENGGGTIPFYFKYLVKEGIVEESYLEFVLTDEMINQDYRLAQAGTYSLKGSITTDSVTEECLAEYYDSVNDICISPTFTSNLPIVQSAFTSCVDYTDSTICPTIDFTVSLFKDGGVYISAGQLYCQISNTGESYCTW